MLFDDDKKEIRDMMDAALKQAIEEGRKPVETDAARRERIMKIKDSIQRQKAISENMDLFRGGRK